MRQETQVEIGREIVERLASGRTPMAEEI
ncbi:MAG: hypothetical protein ACI8TP_004430, partial [Acidimicrobiales bacterium]